MQPRIFVVKNFGRTTLLSRLIFVTALSFWPAVYGSYIGISSFNSLSMLEYKPINQSINLQELHPFNSLSTMEYKSINQPIILQELHRYTLPPLPCWNIFSYFLYILEIQKKPPSFIALLFGRKTVVLVIPVIRRYSITQSLTQSINQSINQSTNQSINKNQTTRTLGTRVNQSLNCSPGRWGLILRIRPAASDLLDERGTKLR